MESVLQLYGLAMVVLPVYAFVSIRKKIRYERLPKKTALMRYAGLVVAPIVGYAVAFGLAVGVETVFPVSVISEEAARSFVLAMVLGIILWLLATVMFAFGLFFVRDMQDQNLL